MPLTSLWGLALSTRLLEIARVNAQRVMAGIDLTEGSGVSLDTPPEIAFLWQAASVSLSVAAGALDIGPNNSAIHPAGLKFFPPDGPLPYVSFHSTLPLKQIVHMSLLFKNGWRRQSQCVNDWSDPNATMYPSLSGLCPETTTHRLHPVLICCYPPLHTARAI